VDCGRPRQNGRIATVIDDVFGNSSFIDLEIGEPRDVEVAVFVRRVVAPLLTWYAGQCVVDAADVAFTRLST